MVTEMAMGKTLDEAKKITKKSVAESLDGLPKEKLLKVKSQLPQRDIFSLTTLLQPAKFGPGCAIGPFTVVAYFLTRRWMSLPGSHLCQSSPKEGAAPGFPLSTLRSMDLAQKTQCQGVVPLFSNLLFASSP
jgi:hypothetical protein